MKLVLVVLVALLMVLQFRLWVGDGSIAEVWRLRQAVAMQTEENAVLRARNQRLDAEVRDLKEGLSAVEERARRDMGMVGKDETFYQIVEE